MGRPLGAPGDSARQRATLLAALRLLEHATEPGTILEMPSAYRPQPGDPGEEHPHAIPGHDRFA